MALCTLDDIVRQVLFAKLVDQLQGCVLQLTIEAQHVTVGSLFEVAFPLWDRLKIDAFPVNLVLNFLDDNRGSKAGQVGVSLTDLKVKVGLLQGGVDALAALLEPLDSISVIGQVLIPERQVEPHHGWAGKV